MNRRDFLGAGAVGAVSVTSLMCTTAIMAPRTAPKLRERVVDHSADALRYMLIPNRRVGKTAEDRAVEALVEAGIRPTRRGYVKLVAEQAEPVFIGMDLAGEESCA